MHIRRLDLTWALLLLATLTTWLIGDLEQGATAAPVAAMATVGVITFFKGRAVALDFMGLRRITFLWRGLVLGWLALVLGLVALAWRALQEWRARRRLAPHGFVLLTVLVYFAGVTAGLSMTWSRYLTPTVLLACLLAGIGCGELAARVALLRPASAQGRDPLANPRRGGLPGDIEPAG